MSGRPRKAIPRKVYNFKKASLTELNELLSHIPLECAFLEEDVDTCTERVNDLLLAAADMCIPTFTVRKKSNPPWITKDILNKIKKKKRLWRKLKAYSSEALSRKFKELRRSVKKRFWSYHSRIKSKSKRHPEVNAYNRRSVTRPLEQANLFNTHFHSIFCKQSTGAPAPIQIDLQDSRLHVLTNHVTCDTKEVQKLLNRLNANKSCGVDKIPARLLKEIAVTSAIPLSALFNLSFNQGRLLKLWKSANITPVHKDGDRVQVENYRGISLLTIIGKYQERIVYHAISNQVISFIHDSHHGFLTGRSCTT